MTNEQVDLKTLNVYQKINLVMSELSYLKKDKSVGYGQNSYTALTHDQVTMALQPLIVKYRLVVIPSVVQDEYKRYTVQTKKGESDRYEVKCDVSVMIVNIDNPSEHITTTATAHGFDSQDKAPGKAFSMATKYALLKLFMIASGDDEESRVDETRVINNERKQLETELKDLLKSHNKLNQQALKYMSTLDLDGLRTKINEYKQTQPQTEGA